MRVMLSAGVIFAVMFLLSPFLPIVALFVLSGVGAAVCVTFSVIKKPKCERLIVVGFFVFAASLLYILNFYIRVKPLEKIEGNSYVTATVTDGPEAKAVGYKYTVRIKSINGEPLNISAYVYSGDELECEVGEVVSFYGLAENFENDIFYNTKTVNYAKGVYLSLETESVSVIEKDRVTLGIRKLRDKIIEGISASFSGEEGGLLGGIIINDTGGISEELKEDLNMAGYSHLINVSGLHMSIVASFIVLLLGMFFKTDRYLLAAITLAGILFYMFLTGFSVSTVRAGIMLVIYNVGVIINKENDPLNSLGLALTLILSFNPFAIYDPSLVLSVLSTFGIIFASESILHLRTEGRIGDKTEKFLMILAPSFSAVIFSAPASMMFFGEINLISSVSNLFVSALATPLVFSGMTFSILYVAGLPTVARIVGIVAGACCKAIIFLAKIFSGIPLNIKTAGVGIKAVVCLAVALVLVMMGVKGRRKRITALILAVLILLSSVLAVFEGNERQKDALYILSKDKSFVMVCRTDEKTYCFGVDTKTGAYNLISFMRSEGFEDVELLHMGEDKGYSLAAVKYADNNLNINTVSAASEEIKTMLEKTANIEGLYYENIDDDRVTFQGAYKIRVDFDGFSATIALGGIPKAEIIYNGLKKVQIFEEVLDKTAEMNYNEKDGIAYVGNGIFKIAADNGKISITEVKALGYDY